MHLLDGRENTSFKDMTYGPRNSVNKQFICPPHLPDLPFNSLLSSSLFSLTSSICFVSRAHPPMISRHSFKKRNLLIFLRISKVLIFTKSISQSNFYGKHTANIYYRRRLFLDRRFRKDKILDVYCSDAWSWKYVMCLVEVLNGSGF